MWHIAPIQSASVASPIFISAPGSKNMAWQIFHTCLLVGWELQSEQQTCVQISLLWELSAVCGYCLPHSSAGWCFQHQSTLESETWALSYFANSMAAYCRQQWWEYLRPVLSHSSPCQRAVWRSLFADALHAFPVIPDTCHMEHWTPWRWAGATKEAMSLCAPGPRRK